MRAWLFILIVLATFKPIVQVASTEENLSKSLESTLNNRNTIEEEESSEKTKREYSMNDKSRRTNRKYSNRNSIKNSYTDENSRISDDTENSYKSATKPDPESLVQIEKSLLTLFGMSKRPKIDRSKIVIPDAMKQLYAQIMGHELDSVNIPKAGLHTKSANTVRSFTHEESRIDNRFLHHHKFRLYFNITSIPPDEILKAAELTLSRDAVNDGIANRTRHQVLVYDIIRPGIKGKRDPIFLLIDTKSVRINSSDTISLDVQPAVDRWIGEPKRNYGLLVQVVSGRDSSQPPEHKHVRLRRSLDEQHEHWSHKQPLLLTYTDDGRHKPRSIRDANRSKRAHHKRSNKRKNGRGICSRRPLYVDFSDVGWSDWIVAPQGYDAYYCQGDCPFPLSDHLNSTNHAVVQTLVNSISPSRVPKACCVPTQLAAISMLYLNEHNTVVLKNYQDMSVVGCGCR